MPEAASDDISVFTTNRPFRTLNRPSFCDQLTGQRPNPPPPSPRWSLLSGLGSAGFKRLRHGWGEAVLPGSAAEEARLRPTAPRPLPGPPGAWRRVS